MILYSKFSNERDDRFAICTQIAEENGTRTVRKFALSDAGRAHIAHLKESFDALSRIYRSTRFVPNTCRMEEETAAFEYLTGRLLYDDLISLKQENPPAFVDAMKAFFAELDRTADTEFSDTDEFKAVFGDYLPAKGLPASSVTNIDTLPDNIIVSGNDWNVIDYEWTFDFAVPVKYLKWRVLLYFGLRTGSEEELRKGGLYEAAEISEEDEALFSEMERSFQRYVEGETVPLRLQYRGITPGFDLLDKTSGTMVPEERNYVQIEVDGRHPEIIRRPLSGGLIIYEVILDHAETLTIYPAIGPQILTEYSVNIDDRNLYLAEAEYNGFAVDESTLIYNVERPYIRYRVPEDGWKFHLKFRTAPLTVEGASMMMERFPKKTASAEVYKNCGEGYRPEEVSRILVDGSGDAIVSFQLDGVYGVRIDPSDAQCHVTIESLSTDLGPIDPEKITVNGFRYHGNKFLFTEEDPNLVIDQSLWMEGSRLFSIRFHVEDLTPEAAKLMRRELEPMEKTLQFMKTRDEHRLSMIDDRDRLLNYVGQLKVMKGYRKYLKSRKRPDPFESLRYQIENNTDFPGIDRSGIYASFDGVIYRKEYCVFRGWAFDRENPITAVRVKTRNHEELPSELMWKIRDDVNEIYQLDPRAQVGFNVSVNYSEIHDAPLYYEIESRSGFVCVPIDYEEDPSKRQSTKLVEEHDYNEWYGRWAPTEEELLRQRNESFPDGPKFSIVVPLYRTNEFYLRELIASIKEQTYGNWELILSDGSGANSPLNAILTKLEASDSRIHAIRNEEQLRISANTNRAIAAAGGTYLVFCDHDDVLTPDALYENAKLIAAHPEAEMIYSDEDKMTEDGGLQDPHFKPDFSYDLLLSNNYISHLCVVKRSLIEKAGMLNEEFDGSQDYDFILRCAEQAETLDKPGKVTKIRHIPKVLYHWRITEDSTAAKSETKGYAALSGRLALQAHLDRMGIPAEAVDGRINGFYEIAYHWPEKPLVSIIIPNKDHTDDLDLCLKSILGHSSYSNYEVIVIENNSEEAQTFAYYDRLKAEHPEVKIITFKGAFNYSAINNLGVRESKGEYLLFLNNDTSFIYKNGIESMLGICMRGDVGAVGARLYYDDDTIQHAGVVLGLCGLAAHAFAREDRSYAGYMGRIFCTQDMSAVTAACMMVKRSVFEEIDGFFEGLAVAFNDVDFCMKITSAGYRIVYDPAAELYHYESKSRGYENTPEKVARFEHEVDTFKERWPEILEHGDPFYNPNLSLRLGGYRLKDDDE